MYQLYFDFRQASFDWTPLWPGIALCLFGILWTHSAIRAKNRKQIDIAVSFLVLNIALLAFFISILFDHFTYYRSRLQNNQWTQIEGMITDHQPVTLGNGGTERFRMNGMLFAFRGKDHPPIFNQTVAKGGKIRNGLYVRLIFTNKYENAYDWAILRIDIRSP